MNDEYSGELGRRGKAALKLGLAVLLITTLGYYLLGCVTGMNAFYGKSLFSLEDDQWELSECFYAAAITLTTVGYTDLLGTERLELWEDAEGRHRWVSATDEHAEEGYDPATGGLAVDFSWMTRSATAFAVIVGIAFFLYVIAQMTSFFVEGDYEELRILRRTKHQVARLSDHVILCGAGLTTRYAAGRLREAGVSCVFIDQDPLVVQSARRELPDVPTILGDATDEGILLAAGIERAQGLVAALREDGLNLVIVVTAGQLAPKLRVVSRGTEGDSARRLTAAGATVVNPARLAGLRLASVLIRPTAVDFLDEVLHPHEGVHLEEVEIPPDWSGHPLSRLDLASLGIQPVSILSRGREFELYNPRDDEVLSEGDVLELLGKREVLDRLRDRLGSRPGGDGKPPEKPTPQPGREEKAPDGVCAERDRHYIVCGGGETGSWIARELAATGRRFLVLENDPAKVEAMLTELPSTEVLVRDAMDPEALREAGVHEARGIATVLGADRMNLVAIVTALQARKNLRAVTLTEERSQRLYRAGAEMIPSGKFGGGRMASEILRPSVTEFLDHQLEDPRGVRFESVTVCESYPVCGKTLAEAGIHEKVGLRPLALRGPGASPLVTELQGTERLEAGTRIVVVCAAEELARLVDLVGDFE